MTTWNANGSPRPPAIGLGGSQIGIDSAVGDLSDRLDRKRRGARIPFGLAA
jgi:hypothetical protein